MSNEQSFGQVVKAQRRELGLTQDELARRVGCAAITVRKIEADDMQPSVQIAERLAMALNITLEERAAFVRLARTERQPEPATPTPAPLPEEIGIEDLTGKAIRGYALGERVGNGGMGAVYRAVQPLVEREVAIKIILPQFANHPDFIRRFEVEAQLVARLEHPHIVPLYDYWREPGVAYLVMRLLRGGSLRNVLERGPLPLSMTLRTMEQVGSALGAAHRAGVIHRDLKPANILLDEDQNAYLADFGIAKNLGNPNLDDMTQVDAIVGSPAYISPEQIRSEFVRPQTDIYCLGVMLYELLTGDLPFTGPTPIEVLHQHLTTPLPPLAARRSGLPAVLDEVIEHATAKDPEHRYADVDSLLADLRRAIQGEAPTIRSTSPTIALPPLTAADNPYKGLRAFGEGDAADFFGREALTHQLLARLAESGELSRFLAVVGSSGSGKSSVVKAGLIPALRRGGLPGSDKWFIVEMLPGPHPLEELEAALLRIAANPPVEALQVTSLLSQLREDKRGLVRAVRRCLPDDPAVELALVIDQFEEVFTLVQDEAQRAHLLDSLVTTVLDERSRVRLILTLRADFIDRPLGYVDFGELLRQRLEIVLPMTPDELEQAIVGPAERAGLQLESGLTAAILRDVGDQPGALPLLQYALTELFEKRDGRLLTKAAYAEIGGVTGALGRRAEEVFAKLDEASQSIARQLFLRLITLGEGVEDTRRRVLRAELESLTTLGTPGATLGPPVRKADGQGQGSGQGADDGQQTTVVHRLSSVVEVFGKHRLLSFDRDPITRSPTIEVAHEALLREWPRLREWLNDSRADVRWQRQLANAASDWQSAKREVSFLLTGARLGQFEGWAATTSVALTQDERAFLTTSLAERDRREAEERERQQHEFDTVRKLAETEKHRAEEQTQSANRLRLRNRLITAVGVVALVLAALAGLFGLQSSQSATAAQNSASTAQAESLNRATQQALAESERNRADAQAQTAINAQATAQAEAERRAAAEAVAIQERVDAQQQALIASVRELAGAANLNLDIDPERSILLALQAVALTDKTGQPPLIEAQDALHRAVQTSRVQLILSGHTAAVLGLAYSPDGTRLATIADDGTIKIWEAATGKELLSIPTGELTSNAYRSLSFSLDGKYLAASAAPHLAKVWEVASGQELLTLAGHTDEVTAVVFSQDGKLIATSSWDQTAKVWDAASGQELQTFTGQNESINDVAFSPDGAYLATAGEDSAAMLWDAVSGRALFTLPSSTGVTSVAFSPDGKTLVTGGYDTTWKLWDVATGQKLLTGYGHASNVIDVAFDSAGTRIVTADEDGTAKIWEVATGRELLTLAGHASGVLGAAFSPAERGVHVATASRDATIKIWDVSPAGGNEWLNLIGHAERVFAVAYSPDGKYIATGSDDHTAKVWDAATGEEIHTLEGHPGQVYGIAFSPDGARLLTYSTDGATKIWDVVSGKEQLSMTQKAGGVGAAFSPDGKAFAVAVPDALKIFDAATGEELLTLATGNSTGFWLWGVAYRPDGKQIGGVDDANAYVWDAATGKLLFVLSNQGVPVRGIAYSPDGKWIATSSNKATIKIWDAETGVLLNTLTGHTGPTFGVAFSPDGRYLASTSVDGTVKIWNVADNFTSLPLTLYGHTRATLNVAFSPDGTRIVTASRDGTARVYAFKIEDLVTLAQSRLTRTLTVQECQQYLHVDQCP